MRPVARILGLALLCGMAAGAATGQDIVASGDLAEAVRVLQTAPSKARLPCSIWIDGKALLDFAFRYGAGFEARCRLGGVIQPGSQLFAIIGITPRPGRRTVMTERFIIRQSPAHEPSDLYAQAADLQASFSGGFETGPGRYVVEVVLTDRRGHTCRARYTVKAVAPKSARDVPFALQAGAVAPFSDSRWNGALAGKGLRLTVFLNAYNGVPVALQRDITGSVDPVASLGAYNSLGAEYRPTPQYLVDSLASVLSQLPCLSVNLVAFNLDNQELLFHQEGFDSGGFVRLKEALRNMDSSSVRIQALRRGAWANFLVRMTQSETASAQSSDVLLFLGAWGSHEWDKIPKPLAGDIEPSNARVFYFRYFPLVGGAPDGVDRWIERLHGSVFDIRSPEMLARAIHEMLARASVPAPDQKQFHQ